MWFRLEELPKVTPLALAVWRGHQAAHGVVEAGVGDDGRGVDLAAVRRQPNAHRPPALHQHRLHLRVDQHGPACLQDGGDEGVAAGTPGKQKGK